MKSIKLQLIAALTFLCFSCATHVKFPISEVTPGARIDARVHTDKHDNFTIDITAKYLTSPDRLTPSKNTYVFWIETDSKGLVNIGQLQSRSSEKSKLEAVTPFEPKAILITAEDDGNVQYPEGINIARIDL